MHDVIDKYWAGQSLALDIAEMEFEKAYTACEATMEINAKTAELKVMVENGTDEDLLALFSEAAEETNEAKKGIIATFIEKLVNFCRNVAQKIRGLFSKAEIPADMADEKIEVDVPADVVSKASGFRGIISGVLNKMKNGILSDESIELVQRTAAVVGAVGTVAGGVAAAKHWVGTRRAAQKASEDLSKEADEVGGVLEKVKGAISSVTSFFKSDKDKNDAKKDEKGAKKESGGIKGVFAHISNGVKHISEAASKLAKAAIGKISGGDEDSDNDEDPNLDEYGNDKRKAPGAAGRNPHRDELAASRRPRKYGERGTSRGSHSAAAGASGQRLASTGAGSGSRREKAVAASNAARREAADSAASRSNAAARAGQAPGRRHSGTTASTSARRQRRLNGRVAREGAEDFIDISTEEGFAAFEAALENIVAQDYAYESYEDDYDAYDDLDPEQEELAEEAAALEEAAEEFDEIFG